MVRFRSEQGWALSALDSGLFRERAPRLQLQAQRTKVERKVIDEMARWRSARTGFAFKLSLALVDVSEPSGSPLGPVRGLEVARQVGFRRAFGGGRSKSPRGDFAAAIPKRWHSRRKLTVAKTDLCRRFPGHAEGRDSLGDRGLVFLSRRWWRQSPRTSLSRQRQSPGAVLWPAQLTSRHFLRSRCPGAQEFTKSLMESL